MEDWEPISRGLVAELSHRAIGVLLNRSQLWPFREVTWNGGNANYRAADVQKLGTRAVARWLDWERVDWLVTALDPQDDRLVPYRRVTRIR
ncbi:hypothetical protein [Parafrankia elaeagni]|uniref:hypothetical protein n=1 Tax=Parafrankia elaeagni TaxID=222534 RepID=UPI001E5603BB|nr:hypothetical protein [Parafrankia elaeagni]